MEINPPFAQRANDAKSFQDWHPGVKLCQFPKMNQISRKDLLGQNYALFQKKFPDDYNFHPLTFTLPADRQSLAKKMLQEQNNANGNNFW